MQFINDKRLTEDQKNWVSERAKRKPFSVKNTFLLLCQALCVGLASVYLVACSYNVEISEQIANVGNFLVILTFLISLTFVVVSVLLSILITIAMSVKDESDFVTQVEKGMLYENEFIRIVRKRFFELLDVFFLTGLILTGHPFWSICYLGLCAAFYGFNKYCYELSFQLIQHYADKDSVEKLLRNKNLTRFGANNEIENI
jgi:hypothetical protein